MPPDDLEAAVDRRADGDPSTLDRARVRVAEHLPVVLAALVVVALVGGWLTFAAHAAPVTEDRVAGAVDGEGRYDYGATVQRDNPVYPVGTRLEDRRHFVVRIAPRLSGTYTHEYAARDVTGVSVETTLSLRLRAVDDGDVYWETTERVATATAEGPAGTVVVPFDLDVEALAERADGISREVGETPGSVEATLIARTHTTGTAGDRSVSGIETTTLPIDADGNTYEVGDAGRSEESRAEVVERERTRGSGTPLAAVGGPLLAFVGLLGVVALAAGHVFDRVTPPAAVTRRVREGRTRRELDEWITRGRIPGDLRNGPVIEADSLGGLVDVAIDGDERVVEDVAAEAFYVVDGETVYAYRPEGSWADRMAAFRAGRDD